MTAESRRCYISELPDELILIIFRLLIWIPYEIKPMDMVSEEFEAAAIRETRIEYRHKCQLKHLTLKLVCKSWYSLLVPYLYDWITLRYLKHLTHLRSAICNPPMWGDYTEKLGWHTKRLDIEFEDDQLKPNDCEALDVLTDLLPALSNLEVFTTRSPEISGGSRLHPKVLEAISPNLKVFSCPKYTWRVTAKDWHSFIISHPNLVAVYPPLVRPPGDLSLGGIPSARLEHYCACGDGFYHSHGVGWFGPCPSLKRLSLQYHNDFTDGLVGVAMQYTSSLTTLQLSLDTPLWIPRQVQRLRPVLESSPNLTRLDAIVRRGPHGQLNYVTKDPPGLPPVFATLGIRILDMAVMEAEMRSWHVCFLSNLARWNSSEPAVIQFLDDHTMDQFLSGSSDIVKQGKITSWLEPDGALLDLKSVKDLEEFSVQARDRINARRR